MHCALLKTNATSKIISLYHLRHDLLRLTSIPPKFRNVSGLDGICIFPLVHHKRHLSQVSEAFDKQKKQDKGMKPGSYFMLLIPITCFGLGCWQVKRREWKLGIIAHLEEKTREPAVNFPNDIDELKSMEYRKVNLQGHFLHDKEVYLGPRCKLDSSPRGLMGSSPAGYQVITPFKLADRDLTILVNRGWVPKNKLNPKGRLQGQVEDEVKLSGVVRHAENRQTFAPKNPTGSSQMFYYRDVESMAQLTGALPIFIDADLDSSTTGGPIGGQTNVTVRNEHLSYIITWFTLCVATGAMWYSRYVR